MTIPTSNLRTPPPLAQKPIPSHLQGLGRRTLETDTWFPGGFVAHPKENVNEIDLTFTLFRGSFLLSMATVLPTGILFRS